jgi:hypothetical protein
MKNATAYFVIITFFSLLVASSQADARSAFNAYAPPGVYGAWYKIKSHMGVSIFTITAKPIGKTMLKGRVRYWKHSKGKDRQVVEEFIDDIEITTANVVGVIEVSFKGIPTGTAVSGSIRP